MELVVWIDFMLFLVLFFLFVYISATVTITKLHKVYLLFHFTMMLWPFCQFVMKTTENPKFQLFYVKLAFVDAILIAVGWLFFTIFLTEQSHLIRKKVTLILLIPTVVIALAIVINPNGLFVLPKYGGYIQRTYGLLFWSMIGAMIIYAIVSMYIIYRALASNNSPRIKKQVTHVLKGVAVLISFVMLDVFLNVILSLSPTVIPGMTSLGILLSVIFFVVAIHRDKVFDLVTIAHQDIINTIGHGIVVLNDNETVVEINRSLLPYVNLQIGDHFDMAAMLPREQPINKFDVFLHSYLEHPLESAVTEGFYPHINMYASIHTAPIMVGDIMVGRIITFQDMSELRHLIDEANLQNGILQERNLALIRTQNELFQTNKKLQQMALTDSLTGCYNRHYLTQQLENEVIKNMKYQSPFAILLLDIDLFKSINDHYGHLIGDTVLCETVDAIKKTLRKTDILARFGGEEFIIYLPNTNQLQADILAEHVKSIVESNMIFIDDGTRSISITISMGLLSIDSSTDIYTNDPKVNLNDLFESVDKALYQAKKEGRNRIISIAR